MAALAVSITALTILAAAQSDPPPNNRPSLAYDTVRRTTLMFGGLTNVGGVGRRWRAFDELWQWKAAAWTKLPVSGPSPRYGHAMAFDEARGVLVLHGGVNDAAAAQFADTWEWNGERWRQVATDGPAARNHHHLIFDSARKRLVLFGGFDQTTQVMFDDTWSWNGATWTRLAETGLPGRILSGAAYDRDRDRIVVFGGQRTPRRGESETGMLGDTWEWNGERWTRGVPPATPGRRDHNTMAYDQARKRVTLFGGISLNGDEAEYHADTWLWDGATWTRATPGAGPSGRGASAMTYDPDRQRVLLYSGTNRDGLQTDVWEWDGRRWQGIR